jgi:cytochrome b involved in lipid metabolism
MSRKEFDDAISSGRKLVILDDLVLDVDPFISKHPGGRFVIEHNVGTDISKFFFGGYSLEGNIGKQTPGYNHSPFAR